jgi:predicted peptidase
MTTTSGPGPSTILLVLALTLLAPKTSNAGPSSVTGFLDRTVEIDGVTSRYQVYVPFGWTKNKNWPVILFLHGAGERGVDVLLQTQVGLGSAIRLHATRWPFIVVIPQCDPNSFWTEPHPEALALKALKQSMKEFNGDTHRVYLTGISMGGYGNWSLASENPGRFAAIAPICGGIRSTAPGRYAELAKKLKNLPIWIFHGDADERVPVSESRQMNEALTALGADVRYTEYRGVGHNSWDSAYAEPELPQWFLSHSS